MPVATAMSRDRLARLRAALWPRSSRGAVPRAGARAPVSLVVTGGTVVTHGRQRASVIAPGAVAIDGADIVGGRHAAGDRRRATAPPRPSTRRGQIVLPGLVNTHTHAPMVLYRGLADDLALMDWLQKYIFPAEAKTVSPEFVRVGTRLAALEMIESGTTTFADMYYFEEEIAEATREAGLRGVLGQTIIQFPVADAKTPAEGLARAEAFIKAFKDDPLIMPAVAPHAMYTLDGRDAARPRASCRRQYGVPLLIHLAETRGRGRSGAGAARGVARRRTSNRSASGRRGTLAAHGVWVSRRRHRDPEAARRRRVAQPRKQHEAGERHGAGRRATCAPAWRSAWAPTAPPATTTSTCSRRCAQAVVPAQAADRRSAGGAGAATALEMATHRRRPRARAWTRRSARSSAGKRADLIVVGMTGARGRRRCTTRSRTWSTPRAATTCDTTIVNGRVLMRDRKVLTLDEAAVLAEARALARAGPGGRAVTGSGCRATPM